MFTTSKIENFESKSQRHRISSYPPPCCSRHQRSKILKANHNLFVVYSNVIRVVHDIKDRKFWKQITTRPYQIPEKPKLFTTSKIENFESKSQRSRCRQNKQDSCSRHQRSKILKANHNVNSIPPILNVVVHDIKDRKFWKQITTESKWIKSTKKVVHDIKDRKFWKQITTLPVFIFSSTELFTTSKIENFESKSQPPSYDAYKH